MTQADGIRIPWGDEAASEIIAGHLDERGPLLVILRVLQKAFGYLDSRAVPLLAEALNLSRAEVHGVIGFYSDFRSEVPGASIVQVCRAEACQAMGAERLAAHATKQLGVDFGGTTADGAITLEQVFCLGNCALSPAALVHGRLVGRVDEARFDDLVSGVRRP